MHTARLDEVATRAMPKQRLWLCGKLGDFAGAPLLPEWIRRQSGNKMSNSTLAAF